MDSMCECGKKALVPATPGTRMRCGWIVRKGDHLCQRCWRALRNRLRHARQVWVVPAEMYREAA